MPKYYPLDVPISFIPMKSDLLTLDWGTNHFSAEFLIPDDDAHCLRVVFEVCTIVRLLDEMPLSCEDAPGSVKGIIPDHFAYRVEGATFAQTQSAAWIEITGPVTHYQFITGWGCVDVLSPAEPEFEVVPTNMVALARYNDRWERLRLENP